MHVVRHETGSSWLRASSGSLDPTLDGIALAFATRLGDDATTGGYLATVHGHGTGPQGYACLSPGRGKMILGRAPPSACEALAEDVRAVFPRLAGILAPADSAAPFVRAWTRRTDATARQGWAQRLLVLRALRSPRHARGRMRAAAPADRSVLVEWLRAFDEETEVDERGRDPAPVVDSFLERGDLFVWDDGGPVCMAVRNGHGPAGARIGAVYTPPGLRHRGYAAGLTAALSRSLIDAGYWPLTLFAQTANVRSNRIYERLGYEPVQDVRDWWFEYEG